MANEEERNLSIILKEYKEIKENSRHVNAFTQENQEKAIKLLKEKNSSNASFEEEEQAYKDAGLHNE